MSERKLTRATVPMCPRCGAKMAKAGSLPFYECLGMRGCKAVYEHRVYWGYYAVNVAGVVKEMKRFIAQVQTNWMTVADWVDRLEGKQ
jgi:hypothetical protein